MRCVRKLDIWFYHGGCLGRVFPLASEAVSFCRYRPELKESLPVCMYCFQRIFCYTTKVSMQAINPGNFGSAVPGSVTSTEAKT